MLQNQRLIFHFLRPTLLAANPCQDTSKWSCWKPVYQHRRAFCKERFDEEEESDFTQLHHMHRQHERELQQRREHVKHRMIKHKYFRGEQLPNLLTFSEKEQMRLLHARDPDEWTAERLAESFPVSLEVAIKILRSKWKPQSDRRIRTHDETVMLNWERLRTGEFDAILPPDVKEHLQKFADRKPEDLKAIPRSELLRAELPKPKGQEFVSIITSCKKYAEESASHTDNQQMLTAGRKSSTQKSLVARKGEAENETFLLDKVVDKRRMRLEDLKKIKLGPAELDSPQIDVDKVQPSNLEQRAVEAFGNPSGTGIAPSYDENEELSKNVQPAGKPQTSLDHFSKYSSNEIIISAEDCQRYEMSTIKDRIYIPRKLWRKGSTYRLQDCYYDDDGEFLYRVPGMTGQAKQ